MTQNVTVTCNEPSLFEAYVEESFAFLEKDHGFSKKVTRPDQHTAFARYEKTSLYVNLMFGPPAYEPEMSFGRLGVDDAPDAFSFEAGDLIQLASCDHGVSNPGLPEPIANQVEFLARVLRDCGQQCLRNDSRTYEEMKRRRILAVAEWKDQEHGKAVSRKIEARWQAKDYRSLVKICDDFEGKLSTIDAKRLAIAKERA
jgi:hypothetical protein